MTSVKSDAELCHGATLYANLGGGETPKAKLIFPSTHNKMVGKYRFKRIIYY